MGVTFRRNVIVVGAGASKEFGLPTGAELTNKIAQISDIRFDHFGSSLDSGDYRIVETLWKIPTANGEPRRDINPFLHAAWKIRDNMPLAPSIDNFMDTHQDDAEVVLFGKIAIALAIQNAEKDSNLFVLPNDGQASLNFAAAKETWIAKLFQILVAQRKFDDFLAALQNITFVSFNYDRCIHQFLFFASRQYFSLSPDDVNRLMAAINIVYPYGTVGEFTFGNPMGNQTNFGSVNYHETLLKAADGIKTFTERSDTDQIDKIREAFEQAEVVMFLGFGFLPLNMELLVGDDTFEVEKVIATGKGLSQASLQQVSSELGGTFLDTGDFLGLSSDETVADRVSIMDVTCGELFYEFQRFLTR